MPCNPGNCCPYEPENNTLDIYLTNEVKNEKATEVPE